MHDDIPPHPLNDDVALRLLFVVDCPGAKTGLRLEKPATNRLNGTDVTLDLDHSGKFTPKIKY